MGNGANTHRHAVDKRCQRRRKFGARVPIDRADWVRSIHVLKRRLKGVRTQKSLRSIILFFSATSENYLDKVTALWTAVMLKDEI